MARPSFTSETAKAASALGVKAWKEQCARRREVRALLKGKPLQVVDGQDTGQESRQARAALAAELLAQLRLLTNAPASKVQQLGNSAGQQGRSATVKTIAETCALVFGWKESSSPSLILMDRLKTAQTLPSPEPEPTDPSPSPNPSMLLAEPKPIE